MFTDSTTNIDNEPPNGSNDDISNPYGCDQTLYFSACTFNSSAGLVSSSNELDQHQSQKPRSLMYNNWLLLASLQCPFLKEKKVTPNVEYLHANCRYDGTEENIHAKNLQEERTRPFIVVWLQIGKGNLLLDLQKLQKNPIFRISVDIRQNTNFVRAFTTSANVPSNHYIHLSLNTLTHDCQRMGFFLLAFISITWLLMSAYLFRKALDVSPADQLTHFESPPAGKTDTCEQSTSPVESNPIPDQLVFYGQDVWQCQTQKSCSANVMGHNIHKEKSSFKLVDEDEVQPAPEPHMDDDEVAIREPAPYITAEKTVPVVEVKDKGSVQIIQDETTRPSVTSGDATIHNRWYVETVLSHADADLVNLEDNFTFGDQFINDKSQEDEPGKTTVETELESMVTIPIQQASSSIPPLSTLVIDLSPPKRYASLKNFYSATRVSIHGSDQSQFKDLNLHDMNVIANPTLQDSYQNLLLLHLLYHQQEMNGRANQTSRGLPTSKSSCVTITVVPKAEHSRNFSSFSDSKHFVCSTCHKCVFNANHDNSITKFLKEVNSHAKVQSPKTRNKNKPVEPKSHTQKPGRQIAIGQRFSLNKSFAVHEKPNTPRSYLRWIPMGRIFKLVGLRWIPTRKLFDSCTSKVDSEPQNGSNNDITNPYECNETLNVSACTLNLSADASFNPIKERLRASLFNDKWRLLATLKAPLLKEKKGLVQNSVSPTTYVPPSKRDYEILFQPMFDEYPEPPRVERPWILSVRGGNEYPSLDTLSAVSISSENFLLLQRAWMPILILFVQRLYFNPLPCAVFPDPVAVSAPRPVDSSGSPLSTTIDQDVPYASTSPTN
ncbi:hypothetical protein Tco_1500109 [Tanacetum coccineum]